MSVFDILWGLNNHGRWFSILKLKSDVRKWNISGIKYEETDMYVCKNSLLHISWALKGHHDATIILSRSLEDSSFTLLKSEWCVQHCDTLNGRSWREIGCQKIKACHLRDQPTSHHHSADEFSRYYWLDDHHNSSIQSWVLLRFGPIISFFVCEHRQ